MSVFCRQVGVIFERNQKLGFATTWRLRRGEGTYRAVVAGQLLHDPSMHRPCVRIGHCTLLVLYMYAAVIMWLPVGSLRGDTFIEANRIEAGCHQHTAYFRGYSMYV